MAKYTEADLIDMALDQGLSGDDVLVFVEQGLKGSAAPKAPAAPAAPKASQSITALAAPPRRAAPPSDTAAMSMPASRPAPAAPAEEAGATYIDFEEPALVEGMGSVAGQQAKLAELKQRRGEEMAARARQPYSREQRKAETKEFIREGRALAQTAEQERKASDVEKFFKEVLDPKLLGGTMLGGVKQESLKEAFTRQGLRGVSPGTTELPSMRISPKSIGEMMGWAVGIEAGAKLAPEMVRRLPDFMAPSEQELEQQAEQVLQAEEKRAIRKKEAAALPPPSAVEQQLIKDYQKAEKAYRSAVPGYSDALERVEAKPSAILPDGKTVSLDNFRELARTGGLPTTVPKYVRDVLQREPDLSKQYVENPTKLAETALEKVLEDGTMPPYNEVADIIPDADDYKKLAILAGISSADDARSLFKGGRAVRLPYAAQAAEIYKMRGFDTYRAMLDEATRR